MPLISGFIWIKPDFSWQLRPTKPTLTRPDPLPTLRMPAIGAGHAPFDHPHLVAATAGAGEDDWWL